MKLVELSWEKGDKEDRALVHMKGEAEEETHEFSFLSWFRISDRYRMCAQYWHNNIASKFPFLDDR